MNRGRRALAVVVILAAVSSTWWVFGRPPRESAAVPRAERATRISTANPKLSASETSRLISLSDEVRDRLGEDEEAGVQALREQLHTVSVSDEERRTFHGENAEVFGGRPYERSWEAADKLLRIHKVRKQIGVPGPDNGIRYPE